MSVHVQLPKRMGCFGNRSFDEFLERDGDVPVIGAGIEIEWFQDDLGYRDGFSSSVRLIACAGSCSRTFIHCRMMC